MAARGPGEPRRGCGRTLAEPSLACTRAARSRRRMASLGGGSGQELNECGAGRTISPRPRSFDLYAAFADRRRMKKGACPSCVAWAPGGTVRVLARVGVGPISRGDAPRRSPAAWLDWSRAFSGGASLAQRHPGHPLPHPSLPCEACLGLCSTDVSLFSILIPSAPQLSWVV